MIIGKNDDYAWIQTFIDYLKQIIDMIMKLFGSASADDSTAKTE